MSGGLTPCWQLRPSSQREHVSASNSHVMGKMGKTHESQTLRTHKSLYSAAAFKNSKITSGSENVELNQTRQEHSSYYGKNSVSIHAGFVWSKETNYGFAALSDCTDHKAAAVWASLTPTLENGKEKIIIVSDSPSSQYRNKSSGWHS